MEKRKIRVRFAPSPTGPMHIGGVRTALYNFLFARKNNGKFILRIEDTDQRRYVQGAENYIMESLKWCGIEYDESPDKGGKYGPYRQSERKHIYRQYADKLVDEEKAYYAFDTPEELETMRKRLKAEKSDTQQYDSRTRNLMKNSLALPEKEVKKRLNSGEPYVIRIRIPENEDIVVDDLIRGKVVVHSSKLDDKVLFKSDGMPTYHLANIVDDHLMEITHVIRGEEWLPSTPLHVLLYKFFDWEAPEFAHLPLILKPDGNGKLSKRDGDRLGFPVFPIRWKDPMSGEISSGYRESGYFPGAFINMLALLGWNPGTEQEIFNKEELISNFDLGRVGKSGSKFDPEKARWFNHKYLVSKSDERLASLYKKILDEKGIEADVEYISKVVALIKERADFINDFWKQSGFFFKPPENYEPKFVKKQWKENTPEIMTELCSRLEKIENFNAGNIKKVIVAFIEEKGVGMGQIMNPLRLSLVGGGFGPDLMQIAELLGKNEVLTRIKSAVKILTNHLPNQI